MKLSPNFTLDEFLVSQTAPRHGLDMTPPDNVIGNIQSLVVELLQPLRDLAGAPLNISSGYRPPALNKLIGGSAESAHMDGRAADFTIAGLSAREVCDMIIDAALAYDQNILEFDAWTHWSIAGELRRQDLTAYRSNTGAVIYLPGIQSVEGIT